MNALLERIDTKFDEAFDEADVWIRIVGADWMADDLRLNLSVKFNDESEAELWEVTCEGVVEEALSSDGTDVLILTTDSPLLKPYVEEEIELMFSENSLTPEFLLGVVCSCCIEVMGKSGYIQRFMNLRPTVHGIVSSAYGLLGRFPDAVAKRILTALKEQPIRVSALPGRMPKRWTGSEFVSYPALSALEIGESYVLAERFSASRV